MRDFFFAATFLLAAAPAMSDSHPTGFLDRVVEVGGAPHRYQVYVPAEYVPDVRWPVILFLHGSGERGSNGLLQTEIGLGGAIRRHPERYPALVVFPQAPEGGGWTGLAGEIAMAALDRTLAEFNADPARVLLTGLSMGGNGAWSLAFAHPDRFSAVAVVCGFIAARPEFPSFLPLGSASPAKDLARRVRDLPIRIVHGDADPIIPVEGARDIVAALREAGARVDYFELSGVGHDSWNAAYGTPELAAWFFALPPRGAPAK